MSHHALWWPCVSSCSGWLSARGRSFLCCSVRLVQVRFEHLASSRVPLPLGSRLVQIGQCCSLATPRGVLSELWLFPGPWTQAPLSWTVSKAWVGCCPESSWFSRLLPCDDPSCAARVENCHQSAPLFTDRIGRGAFVTSKLTLTSTRLQMEMLALLRVPYCRIGSPGSQWLQVSCS